MTMFLAFGVTFEVPIVVIVLVEMGVGHGREAERDPALRHRGRVHRRGRGHAAGRGLAASAGGAAVPALRGGILVAAMITPRTAAAETSEYQKE